MEDHSAQLFEWPSMATRLRRDRGGESIVHALPNKTNRATVPHSHTWREAPTGRYLRWETVITCSLPLSLIITLLHDRARSCSASPRPQLAISKPGVSIGLLLWGGR